MSCLSYNVLLLISFVLCFCIAATDITPITETKVEGPSTTFDDLPQDVFRKVASTLDPSSTLKLSQTNKKAQKYFSEEAVSLYLDMRRSILSGIVSDEQLPEKTIAAIAVLHNQTFSLVRMMKFPLGDITEMSVQTQLMLFEMLSQVPGHPKELLKLFEAVKDVDFTEAEVSDYAQYGIAALNKLYPYQNMQNEHKRQLQLSLKYYQEGIAEVLLLYSRQSYSLFNMLFKNSQSNSPGLAHLVQLVFSKNVESFKNDDQLRNKTIKSMFFQAASNSQYSTVQCFIDNGVDVDIHQDKNGGTLLYWAAYNNNLNMVRLLVENKANVNVYDNFDNYTPLQLAAFNNNLDMVKFLVQNKADVNIQDIYGQTPLYCAAFHNNLDMVKFLVENKADVNLQENDGETALYLLVAKKIYANAQFLLERGASVDEMSWKKALQGNDKSMISLLSQYRVLSPVRKKLRSTMQWLKQK